jgi:predicted branched-subunit amino acid permease
MNEPTIAEILAALKPEEIKETVTDALPVSLLTIALSVVFSLLMYPVSMILASFNRGFGFPEIPDWIYTALFLGIVFWMIRGQSAHLPILGPVAWTILIVLVISVIFACIYLPGWAVLPSILFFLTPVYLFAKLLEKGREKIETGTV